VKLQLALIAVAITSGVQISFAESPSNPKLATDTSSLLFCDPGNQTLISQFASNVDSWESVFKGAQSASENGMPMQAFNLAIRATCLVRSQTPEISTQIDVAAFAIEAALDTDNQENATSIASAFGDEFARVKDEFNSKSALRWQLAEARMMAYNERNFDALALRKTLEPKLVETFGRDSEENLINQIRTCNIKLQLGDIKDALNQLQTLNGTYSFKETTSWRLRNLLVRATASAEALAGKELDAIQLLNEFKERLTKAFGPSDFRAVGIEENLSEIFTKIDQYEDAIESASRVYLWRQDNLPPKDLGILRSLWQLACLYIEVSRLETAGSVLQTLSDELSQDTVGGRRILYLQVMSLQANLDSGRGDYAEARKKWQIVYSGLVSMYGPNSADARLEAANLAFAMRRTGQAQEACEFLGNLKKTFTNSQLDDSWLDEFAHIENSECVLEQSQNQADRKSTLESLEVSWGVIAQHVGMSNRNSVDALAKVADLFLRFGDEASAKRKLSLLVNLTEAERTHAFKGSLARMNAYSRWISDAPGSSNPINGYRNLAFLDAEKGELESALQISELIRDRTLADRFFEARFNHLLPPGARNRNLELAGKMQELEEEISFTTRLTERIRLESERNLLAGIRGRMEREYVNKEGPGSIMEYVAQLDDAREALKVGEVLVSILRSRDKWWALVLLKDEPAHFVKFEDPDLSKIAGAWMLWLHGNPVRAWRNNANRIEVGFVRPNDAEASQLNESEIQKRLSEDIFAPLSEYLVSAKCLIVIGDGDLDGLPLQTLQVGGYLAVEKYVIDYAPSISIFVQMRRANRNVSFRKDLLAIAAADALVPESLTPRREDHVVNQTNDGVNLIHVRDEVEAIGDLFPVKRRSIWIGNSETKVRIREASISGELEQYRFIHFAGHAIADFADPERSIIVVSGLDKVPNKQRTITAGEISGLRMSADLFVLAGCETAVGWYGSSQGLLGFAYAGLAAGNRSELLTLWPIEDRLTAQFMGDLYARLRRGVAPSIALAETQRQFLHSYDPHMADLRSWAPYVIYGAN
jgi:CHAT domain-containing protein